MKLKHLFFNALAVMAFAACSSEAEEIKPAEKSETATVEIDLEGEYNNGQTRALTFDGTEYPLFTHETGVTDWKTHCFIRNEAGTVQFYALVDWTASVNSSTGAITLKIKDSKLTLQGSGGSNPATTATLPKAGERWYIAGIAGGGVLEANNTKVNFAYNQSLDASLAANQLRVPIAFGWTPFTIAKPVSERAPRIVVQFKPQGTLLSVHVDNTKNRGKDALSTQVKVRSNALSQSGLFDYSTAAARAIYTAAPKWDFTNVSATTETFVRDVNIDFGAKKIYYLWAMPRTSAPTEGFKTETYVAHYKSFAEGTNTVPVAKTTTFAKGNTYYTGLDIDRPKIALEYVAGYLTSSGGVTTSNKADDIGYFLLSEIPSLTVPNGYQINDNAYWRAAFIDGSRGKLTFKNLTSDDLVDKSTIEWVMNPSTPTLRWFTSTYKTPGNGIAYALRLGKSSTPDESAEHAKDNRALTAYRYETKGDFTIGSENSYLEVKAYYLGEGFQGSIETIANEDYWLNLSQSEVITQKIYATGYRLADGTLKRYGTIGALYSSTVYNFTDGGHVGVGPFISDLHAWTRTFTPIEPNWYGEADAFNLFDPNDKYPIRLFTVD